MKLIFIYCSALFAVCNANAQNTFRSIVKDNDGKILPGTTVNISVAEKKALADSSGVIVIRNIPDGKFNFVFSHIGFKEKIISYTFPLLNDTITEVIMETEEQEEGEVVVTSTRTSRSIANIPTRVETISGEELSEKANMKPGDIRMLLNESTGIQTQQTSATSYNSSIRIQGLDGRYTQIIRDGLPLYSGFSGGLSIMQVAPLDLKQVEVIKGASSTLYGGGAIAGLVNLVSRTPTEKRQLNFMTNITSAGGLDIAGFYAEKFKRIGISLFASRNSNRPYDPAGIDLTAIPKFERYTFNPRLFIYITDKTQMDIGFTTITENRIGGDMHYIKNGIGYFEKNKTNRFTTQLSFRHILHNEAEISLKNSYNRFNRRIQIPGYLFEGLQQSSFTELSYNAVKNKFQWVAGVNVITDQFTENKQPDVAPRDYSQNTVGTFVQNIWTAAKWFTLETGLRGDYVNKYGFNLLPRFSALFKINPQLTSRLGGGLGYKPPTVFTEEAERVQFQNILPVNPDAANTERSEGLNFDINYRTKLFDAVSFSANYLVFYTRLNKPLVLAPVGNGKSAFLNLDGFIDTRGMETNVRLIYKDVKLFVGYTYAEVHTHTGDTKSWLPLTPKHRLNNVLVYEKEQKLKIGLEAYYFSRQQLSDGATGKAYWICGAMAERSWKKFSVFINFENIFDVRQIRFDTIYTGTITQPVFRDIYAPVDGFIVNGGVKVKL